MDQPHYKFKNFRSGELYSFTSEGKNGSVKKMVQFSRMHDDVFNLGFGDWNEEDKTIDDKVISNNGDMEIILATVIKITQRFLSLNKGATIGFTGSTPARTRLYQIIINKNLEFINSRFDIWGFMEGTWYTFEKNVNYEAFLISELL